MVVIISSPSLMVKTNHLATPNWLQGKLSDVMWLERHMFQARERINFSGQLPIPVPWSSLQPLNIPLYLSPLPRNINEISIRFLDPAQSSTSGWGLDFCIRCIYGCMWQSRKWNYCPIRASNYNGWEWTKTLFVNERRNGIHSAPPRTRLFHQRGIEKIPCLGSDVLSHVLYESKFCPLGMFPSALCFKATAEVDFGKTVILVASFLQV